MATKPLMQMRGFFNATQRRKLAFESWGALKKPNECEAFFERLWVRINAEDGNAQHWQSRYLVRSQFGSQRTK